MVLFSLVCTWMINAGGSRGQAQALVGGGRALYSRQIFRASLTRFGQCVHEKLSRRILTTVADFPSQVGNDKLHEIESDAALTAGISCLLVLQH